MQKRSIKYSLKFLSLILLISFIYTSLPLCEIASAECQMEKSSCCQSEENNDSSGAKLDKKCCCNLKETNSQKPDAVLNFNEIQQKDLSAPLNIYFDNFGLTYNMLFNVRILSFHSPPTEDIYILNSNFRI